MDAIDPCVVRRRRPSAEGTLGDLRQGSTDPSELAFADHEPCDISSRWLIREWCVGERADDLPWGRLRTSSLDRCGKRAHEPLRLLAGRDLELAPVLEPTAAGELDAPALHLDHDDAELGDGDDEVAFALTVAGTPQPQRVPRAPAVGELGLERRV